MSAGDFDELKKSEIADDVQVGQLDEVEKDDGLLDWDNMDEADPIVHGEECEHC